MIKKILSVKKPWGRFTRYTTGQKTTVKIIELKKGGILSLQSHKKRDELWVALDSGLVAQIENRKNILKKGQKLFIKRGQKHRLSSKNGGRILEISFGKFRESDIVRFEDKYGRIRSKKD